MQDTIGLYVHYPFCLSLCHYCDFNSFIRRDINEDDFVSTYLDEIDYYSQKALNKRLASIYFGGGTPSLMRSSDLEKIINYAAKNFIFDNDIEITLEANPSSIENRKMLDFKNAGVNRVSIGVQALNDKDLSFLTRKHTATEAIDAINIAKKHFNEFSFDLIYARHSKQTLEQWCSELKYAISLAGNHLSLYSLVIEKGTEFFTQYKNNKFPKIESKLAEDMYFATIEIMQNNGFERYEVSNFARSGKRSKHNMNYWLINDYIGIGAGAHGRLFYKNKVRMQTMTQHKPQKWLESVQHSIGLQIEKPIIKKEQVMEILMMGLRIVDGIDIIDIRDRIGIDLLVEKNIKNALETNILFLDNDRYLKPYNMDMIGHIIRKIDQMSS